jgi:hypothetical protein
MGEAIEAVLGDTGNRQSSKGRSMTSPCCEIRFDSKGNESIIISHQVTILMDDAEQLPRQGRHLAPSPRSPDS